MSNENSRVNCQWPVGSPRGRPVIVPAGVGRMSWPLTVNYMCETCGKATAVNLRTGRVNWHHMPGTRESCGESGLLVAEPDDSFEPVKRSRMDWAATGSIPHQCEVCGQKTRLNPRTEIVYSHNLKGTTEVCAGSSRTGRPGRSQPVVQ